MEIKNLEGKQMGKEEEEMKLELEKKSGNKDQNGASRQHRVVINEEANKQLESYLEKAGEGNEPVNISKSDLANYVFCNLSRFLSESDLKILRSQHFDERSVLKELLKQMKQDNEIPSELKKALREHYGISERDGKRLAKTIQRPKFDQEA